jgi:hypothetical protein
MATFHDGEKEVHEVGYDGEKPTGNVHSVNAQSVALAAAVAAQKPKLLSPNMIKLYMIMAIGYLVSTMNGFGMIATPEWQKAATDTRYRFIAHGSYQCYGAIPEGYGAQRSRIQLWHRIYRLQPRADRRLPLLRLIG